MGSQRVRIQEKVPYVRDDIIIFPDNSDSYSKINRFINSKFIINNTQNTYVCGKNR